MMRKVMIALAAGLLAFQLGRGPVAASTCSVEVSPLTVETRVEPNHAHTGSIELKNAGDETQHIRAYCQDWTLKPDGLVVFVEAGKLPNSASQWVSLSPAEFDLGAGESALVRYTIRLPADAVGEYRTVIIFEAGAQQMTLHGSRSRVVPRVGTVLYLQSGAGSAPQAKVVQFSATVEGGLLAVENLGGSHLRVTGRLEVRRGGELIESTDLTGFVVLPAPFNQHQTKFAKEAFSDLPPGDYELTAILDCGGPSLLGARTSLMVRPTSAAASAK